jgi:hypothetical protein
LCTNVDRFVGRGHPLPAEIRFRLTDDGHQDPGDGAASAPRTQKPFSASWKSNPLDEPASISWFDDSGCSFMPGFYINCFPAALANPMHPAWRRLNRKTFVPTLALTHEEC